MSTTIDTIDIFKKYFGDIIDLLCTNHYDNSEYVGDNVDDTGEDTDGDDIDI